MFLNSKSFILLKNIEEATKITTKAAIVDAWSKKYCINKDMLAVIWRRAELIAAKSKKCKCIPWGVVTDIFKLSVRKHFKLDKCARKDIQPAIIKGKYVQTHKDVMPGGALYKKYMAEIKELEKECPGYDKLPDCPMQSRKAMTENSNNLIKGLGAAVAAGTGVGGLMYGVNQVAPSHHNEIATHLTNTFQHLMNH